MTTEIGFIYYQLPELFVCKMITFQSFIALRKYVMIFVQAENML